MPRQRASDLVLRARLALERVRHGEADRPLVNQLAQVCLVTGFIVENGHGDLAQRVIEEAEHGLGNLLRGFEQTGQWPDRSPELVDCLTAVINEYDRLLATVRLAVIARASDYLDRLKAAAASTPPSVAKPSGGASPACPDRHPGGEGPAPTTSPTSTKA